MIIISIKKRLVVGVLLACAAQISTADSVVSLGEQITDGGFPTLASWDVSGSVDIGTPIDTINTSGGNAGFNSFFDSSFANLGDVSGIIGGAPNTGTATLSQTFTLSSSNNASQVSSYDLDISFFTVFDGDDSIPFSVLDIFSASLNGTLLFSQDSAPLPDCTPSSACPNNQVVNDPFSTTLFGLAPGTYTLTFTLNEAPTTSGGSVTNTSAGIDNVSVIALAHIPEPSTLALLGLGLLGLTWRRQVPRRA